MKLSKAQRATVREMCGGRCAYCGRELDVRWHADHVEPIRRDFNYVRGRAVPNGKLLRPENDHIDNLLPACAPCNIRKHASSLEDFRHGMQRSIEVARAASSAYRHALRFGLLEERPGPVVFYFEKLRSAAPKGPLSAEGFAMMQGVPAESAAPLPVQGQDTARLNIVLDTFGKREDNMPLTQAERDLIAAFDDRGGYTKGMKLRCIDDALRASSAPTTEQENSDAR